jgi:hypothetical protein
MSQTKFQNTVFDCTMDAPGNGVPTNSQNARAFLDAIEAMHNAIPLSKFDLERDAVDLELYSYKFESVSGKRWNQEFRIADGEVSMSFDTKGDFWMEAEFVPHRDVRDKTIAMIKVHGCFDIRCRW